jgi:Asp-tRNA(Asn)/Glu-tRNA(Gln) amidotransferase B subunit
MEPFRKKYYYTPDMQGSYSIKSVLPALVPALSYKEMEIGDGSAASSAFENLYYETDPAKIKSVRENLLRYCSLDTLAMVEVFKFLSSLTIEEEE